ncbi:glutamate receptor ionotropic, NMDA 3A-like, partial [Agrilus planipennis]
LPCHRVLTHDKDNLTLVFNELDKLEEEHEEAKTFGHFGHFQHLASSERFHPFYKYKYRTNCCYGLSMDLLENIAHELEFDFHLYIVADGLFGSKVVSDKKTRRDVGRSFWVNRFQKEQVTTGDVVNGGNRVEVKWNGIVGDLMSEAAHMSFAALSVSSVRSEVIDFSVPYFFAGVSSLAAPQQKSEIPLMAFLLPFSTELWIAIFTSLNITAIAVAIYEWLSPFGLNPWGRQRSKNFSMSSALWVMWGLLCGHLVAFKAPKSWPNKFLINVWGGFSVIFVASYTANIAALIAGLFFRNTGNYYDRT